MNDIKSALLYTEKPSEFFDELRENGTLENMLPELYALVGVPQNINYHKEGDAYTHTMMVLDEAAKRRDNAKNRLGFMLSALCHDFGKAVSTTVSEDGTVHSYSHETEGLPIVKGFMERFSDDSKLTEYVLNMTKLHMEPNIMANARSKIKKTNRLFDSSAEPYDLILLSICDGHGKIPQNIGSEEFLMQRYQAFLEIMSRPFVTERDLTDSGIVQGENLQKILEYSHKLRLAGVEKDNALRQSIAYAGSVLKIKVKE